MHIKVITLFALYCILGKHSSNNVAKIMLEELHAIRTGNMKTPKGAVQLSQPRKVVRPTIFLSFVSNFGISPFFGYFYSMIIMNKRIKCLSENE